MTTLFFNRNFKTGGLYFYLSFFACCIFSTSNSQDLLKMIPANASGVITMNGSAFFKKIDLDQINRLEMFKEMDEQTKGRRGSRYNEYSKIYKDPASIGLNMYSKCYLYFEQSADTSMWGTRYTYTGLLIPLSKSKKFESFLKKISDSSIVKQGAWKYAVTGYGTLVGWNKTQMIVLFTTAYGEDKNHLLVSQFNRVINLPTGESVRSNKNFMEAQTRTFDFNYWMNFESALGNLLPMYYMAIPGLKNIPFISPDFYKEYYLQTNLNFNNGDISMDAKQFLSKESGEKIKEVYGKGVNSDMMKFIHKDHLLGIYSYSLNMKGIKAILDTALTDSIKNSINEGFIGLLYDDKVKQDPKMKKIQAQVDSMYADLYPSIDYDEYQYDTTSAVEDYEQYDSDYEENPDNADIVLDEEISPPKEYVPDSLNTDKIGIDNTSDTAYAEAEESVVIDESYSYTQTKEDSLYDVKYERINKKKDELDVRKKELLQKKIKELNLSKDFLLELFQGDAMGAITDYFFVKKKYKSYEYDDEELKTVEVEKEKNEPHPEYLIGFTLNNADDAKKFINKLTKDSFLLKQSNYHQINADWDVKVFVAVTENILLITNDEDLLKKNFSGYAAEERISKELQDILLHKTTSGYVNIREIFARLPFDNLSPERHATFTLLMNSFKGAHFTSTQYANNISDTNFSVEFTNKLDNSFYEIFRIINEIYKINNHKE